MPTKPHSMPDPFAGQDRPDYVPPKLTPEMREVAEAAMAACDHGDRAVARGRAAGALHRKFGVDLCTAVYLVQQCTDRPPFEVVPTERGYELVRKELGPNPSLSKGSKAD